MLDDVLAAVAESGLGAHVDLKGLDAGEWAEELAERCAEALDLGRVVFTTGNAQAAASLARWAEAHDAPPLVGLTVGQSTAHLRLPAAVRARIGELYPTPAVARERRRRAGGAPRAGPGPAAALGEPPRGPRAGVDRRLAARSSPRHCGTRACGW